MTEKMRMRLADLRARQSAGEHMLCPRCGQNTMREDICTNALSRHEDGIYVCSACGTAEALLDFMNQELPLTQWAFFRPQRQASAFGSMAPEDVAEEVERNQIRILKNIFKLCEQDAKNAYEYRADAFESCPGLVELWTQPFMARYDTASTPVVVRFHSNPDTGKTEYSIDLLGEKRNKKD